MAESAPSATLLHTSALDELFADAPIGLAVLDRDLRYRRVNRALAAINGRPVDAHVGRTIREVLPHSADLIEPLIRRVLDGEALLEIDIAEPGAEGRHFRATYLPVRGGDGLIAGAAALIVETTDRRRAENALRRTEERLRLALEGTATGSWDWEFSSGEIRWSENLGPLMGRPRGSQPESFEDFLSGVHPEDRDRLQAEVRAAVDEERRFDVEFRTCWPDGTMRWLHSRGHVLRDDDGRPASMLGLIDDVTERLERERDLQFLARASAALAASLDVPATLQHVAELAVPALAQWCTIVLTVPGGGLETVAVAHEDFDRVELAEELQRRYPPDATAPIGPAAVVRSGQPELYAHVSDDVLVTAARDDEHLRLLRELGLRSAMVVPIAARGRTLGAMTFVTSRPGREYHEEDLRLAEELGRRAGVALDNAQLHALETESRQRLQALQTIIEVGLDPVGMSELLDELLRRIRVVTGADFAVVLLLQEDGRSLAVEAVQGIDVPAGARVEAGHGVAGRVLASRAPLVGREVDERELGLPAAGAVAGSLLSVPLRAGTETLGVLHLGTVEPGGLGADELPLLELVADRAARSISHARLYEQTRDTALTLQRSLLPAALPPVPGVVSAARYVPGQAGLEVGGDWYDLLPLDDGCHALVVGDVVGRGLRAAATMGNLRASVRAYLHQSQDPAAAIGLVDDLVGALGDVSFATLAVVALDPAQRTATVCSAGHPPPLLIADGSARLLDVPTGPPIGVGGAERRSCSIELPADATIALYTDGLVESRHEPIDERFSLLCRAAATAPRDPDRLLDHLLDVMLGGQAHRDDAALVAVRLS